MHRHFMTVNSMKELSNSPKPTLSHVDIDSPCSPLSNTLRGRLHTPPTRCRDLSRDPPVIRGELLKSPRRVSVSPVRRRSGSGSGHPSSHGRYDSRSGSMTTTNTLQSPCAPTPPQIPSRKVSQRNKGLSGTKEYFDVKSSPLSQIPVCAHRTGEINSSIHVWKIAPSMVESGNRIESLNKQQQSLTSPITYSPASSHSPLVTQLRSQTTNPSSQLALSAPRFPKDFRTAE